MRLPRISMGISVPLLGKVEMMNPGGSVKDRIALAMLDTAVREGHLPPGATLIEATAGNTGIGLAMVAAIRGYHCVFVMPEKISRDKEDLLRAYGAEVLRVPNAPPDSPDFFQTVARRLAAERGWFLTDQFANAANPEVHYHTTGSEIWEDTAGEIDAFVCGVGTGGTITGVGRYLRERNPDVRLILADPESSTYGGGEPGTYLLEGIGGAVPPANFDTSLVDEVITVSDKDAFLMTRRLAREEGMLVGGTAGCGVVAALQYAARPDNEGQSIVVLLPDTGRNYMTKVFRDEWMTEKGFL